MKPFLIILISLLTTLTAYGQQPEYPDSGFTNKSEAKNLIVNGQKEGKWVEYFDNTEYPMGTSGYILTIYKNGNKIGLERGYYMSSKLQWLCPYSDGKLNGLYKGYYENGTLMQETPYLNDKINGSAKYYIESGVLSVESPYANGNENGIEKWYDENGKLEKEVLYNNGEEGLIKEYYDNGKLKNVSIDTVERVQKMLIGTWAGINNPWDIWVFTRDSVRNNKFCGTDYSIYLKEPYIGSRVTGKYWFRFDYVTCGDSDITNRPDFEGTFSIDSTQLELRAAYDADFVYIKKK